MQKKRIFPACLFLMFVLMILVIGKETDMTGRGETQKIRNLSDGWYYLKDGERTEVTLPTTLQEDPGTVLELYNDTVTDEQRYGSSYLGSTISPADPDRWKNNLSVS